MTPNVGLVGDVMLGRNVDRRHRSKPPAAVWGDVLNRLEGLDGLFINLECVLSTRGRPWRRTYRPFHFRADPDWAIPALGAAGVTAASLANNHLMDYGPVALQDTVDALNEAAIAHAGAGPTRTAARRPTQFSVDGVDVALVSFTDNTPEYAAGADEPGVAYNAFDPDDAEAMAVLEATIGRARSPEPDVLVASLHAGPNMRTEPLDRHVTLTHRLADLGVDVVHGHSAHVFQGVEVYDGTFILHDAGDFVDDYAVDDELRNDRGFLFDLGIEDGQPRTLVLHPTEIQDCAVHEAGPEAARWSRERMRARSAPFDTDFTREGAALVLEIG